MRTALYHIFKKNGLLIVIVLVLFCTVKYKSVLNIQELCSMDSSMLQTWLEQCSSLDSTETEAFIKELRTSSYTDSNADPAVFKEYLRLESSYSNMKNVNFLIRFAHEKEGMLPMTLPYDYIHLLDFYANLSAPSLLDENPLTIYWKLQNGSIVFILILFITAVFYGQYYEAGIYDYTQVTSRGTSYRRAFHGLLLALCFFFFLCNEFFDLLYSGLLSNPQILNASLQSYSSFINTQMNLSIGECLSLVFISKILGTLLLYQFVRFFASRKKNIRDSLIASVFLILILLMAGQPMGLYSPLIQIGIIDWEDLIRNTNRLPGSPLSFFSMGILLSLIVEILMLFVIHPVKFKKVFHKEKSL